MALVELVEVCVICRRDDQRVINVLIRQELPGPVYDTFAILSSPGEVTIWELVEDDCFEFIYVAPRLVESDLIAFEWEHDCTDELVGDLAAMRSRSFAITDCDDLFLEIWNADALDENRELTVATLIHPSASGLRARRSAGRDED